MEQQAPPLTVEEFYEKSFKLNEVYQNNMAEMNRTFGEKQKALFDRLTDEDKNLVVKMETEKREALMRKIVAPAKDIVDLAGRKMTTH